MYARHSGNWWPFLGAVLTMLVLFAPATASAQFRLPDVEGDADKTQQDDKDEKRRRGRRRHRRRAEPKCEPGRQVSEDTQGHCCWPGQAWNGAACVGTPDACPEGLTASADKQACVVQPCEAAMVLVDDTHCCWPAQGWSASSNMCVGHPECPDGFAAGAGEVGCEPVRIAQPAPDMDGDGMPDSMDRCPRDAEDVNGLEDDDGCPDAGVLTAQDGGVGSTGVAGWVLLGTGIALAGGGGALWFVAEGKRDQVRDASTVTSSKGETVITGVGQNEAYELEDDANLYATLGWTGIGVGASAFVAGLVLIVVDSGLVDSGPGEAAGAAKRSGRSEPSWDATVALYGDGAGLLLLHRF